MDIQLLYKGRRYILSLDADSNECTDNEEFIKLIDEGVQEWIEEHEQDLLEEVFLDIFTEYATRPKGYFDHWRTFAVHLYQDVLKAFTCSQYLNQLLAKVVSEKFGLVQQKVSLIPFMEDLIEERESDWDTMTAIEMGYASFLDKGSWHYGYVNLSTDKGHNEYLLR